MPKNKIKYFSEEQTRELFFRVGIKKTICSKKTPYQKIEIFETYPLGKLFALDRAVMLTEKDEAFYHEMLVHPAMFLNAKPQDVLIIGGGDGGTLREVLRHRSVRKALMAEIDGGVIEACKKYLPGISQGAFNDKKADVRIIDGAKFLKETKMKFDIVLVDSTDPVGPAKVLFSRPFFEAAYRCLNKEGLFACQSGSPFYYPKELRETYHKLKEIFPWVKVYLGFIPGYPSGLWSFCLASRKIYNLNQPVKIPFSTKFYNAQIHQAAFKLPQFIADLLR